MFADKLIALNNENFSGQISSTDIIIQFFTNWPSVKGFPALAIMWLTLKLALKADSFYCVRLVKICLCADNEFFKRRNFVLSNFQIYFCIILSFTLNSLKTILVSQQIRHKALLLLSNMK